MKQKKIWKTVVTRIDIGSLPMKNSTRRGVMRAESTVCRVSPTIGVEMKMRKEGEQT